ncbi:MAG: 16S rRNA (uracil(1498)-N(3))-methyltransferase [Myxococcales bacterium]|nr:16S rRNA (uracil(1498)-N(3))-methyltransferase [Myxococcales bacterium]
MRRLVLPAGSFRGHEGRRLEISPELAQHLRVLRVGEGQELELTDGEGWVASGVVDRLDRRGAWILLRTIEAAPAPSRPEIVLLQGVGKGDKLDTVTRQVAEMGVARLVPVLTERSVATRHQRIDRLRVIVDDAVRVSGRAHRMQVAPPTLLKDALQCEADLRIVLQLGGQKSLRTLLEMDTKPSVVALLVGPEGGFSTAEIEAAGQAAFVCAHMGSYTFRTETAGPAAVAMTRYAYL